MLLTTLLTGRKNAPQKSQENTVKYHVLQPLLTGKSSIISIFCKKSHEKTVKYHKNQKW